MMYGVLPPKGLPKQDTEKVLFLLERWSRSSRALSKWAERATECVDFLENRQWTDEQKAALKAQGRPILSFNKIRPLVNLINGYFRNNRTDAKVFPGHDGSGSQETAEAISSILKHVGNQNKIRHIDAETFLDGITTGRGYQDQRLDFSENDFGEIAIKSLNPFSVFPDPDLEEYDLNKGSSISTSEWVSVEEIEINFGKKAAELVKPFMSSSMGWTSFPTSIELEGNHNEPIRSFDMDSDVDEEHRPFRDMFEDYFIDRSRKMIRMVDMQWAKTEIMPTLVDLETGDRSAIPAHWTPEKVQKVLAWGESVGNPMRVVNRPHRNIYWTIMIGDMIVYDQRSPYSSYTINGYFPYFRRGITQGIVEDLIDPQKELNKNRMAQIDIVGRSAAGGWKIHEDSMTPDQKASVKKFGSRPGYVMEWSGEKEPKEINVAPPPGSQERLEDRARNDLRDISGINEAALGQIDAASASGRAVEARQRQAVIGLQMYIDNWSRTKTQQGEKSVELIQQHYTEPRMFRIIGENGSVARALINMRQSGSILNDVTSGKYIVEVDETPMSATFQSAQFEEALLMIEKLNGVVPVELFADKLIDLSSMPGKEEFKLRIQQALGIQPEAPIIGDTALSSGVVPLPGQAAPAQIAPPQAVVA